MSTDSVPIVTTFQKLSLKEFRSKVKGNPTFRIWEQGTTINDLLKPSSSQDFTGYHKLHIENKDVIIKVEDRTVREAYSINKEFLDMIKTGSTYKESDLGDILENDMTIFKKHLTHMDIDIFDRAITPLPKGQTIYLRSQGFRIAQTSKNSGYFDLVAVLQSSKPISTATIGTGTNITAARTDVGDEKKDDEGNEFGGDWFGFQAYEIEGMYATRYLAKSPSFVQGNDVEVHSNHIDYSNKRSALPTGVKHSGDISEHSRLLQHVTIETNNFEASMYAVLAGYNNSMIRSFGPSVVFIMGASIDDDASPVLYWTILPNDEASAGDHISNAVLCVAPLESDPTIVGVQFLQNPVFGMTTTGSSEAGNILDEYQQLVLETVNMQKFCLPIPSVTATNNTTIAPVVVDQIINDMNGVDNEDDDNVMDVTSTISSTIPSTVNQRVFVLGAEKACQPFLSAFSFNPNRSVLIREDHDQVTSAEEKSGDAVVRIGESKVPSVGVAPYFSYLHYLSTKKYIDLQGSMSLLAPSCKVDKSYKVIHSNQSKTISSLNQNKTYLSVLILAPDSISDAGRGFLLAQNNRYILDYAVIIQLTDVPLTKTAAKMTASEREAAVLGVKMNFPNCGVNTLLAVGFPCGTVLAYESANISGWISTGSTVESESNVSSSNSRYFVLPRTTVGEDITKNLQSFLSAGVYKNSTNDLTVAAPNDSSGNNSTIWPQLPVGAHFNPLQSTSAGDSATAASLSLVDLSRVEDRANIRYSLGREQNGSTVTLAEFVDQSMELPPEEISRVCSAMSRVLSEPEAIAARTLLVKKFKARIDELTSPFKERQTELSNENKALKLQLVKFRLGNKVGQNEGDVALDVTSMETTIDVIAVEDRLKQVRLELVQLQEQTTVIRKSVDEKYLLVSSLSSARNGQVAAVKIGLKMAVRETNVKAAEELKDAVMKSSDKLVELLDDPTLEGVTVSVLFTVYDMKSICDTIVKGYIVEEKSYTNTNYVSESKMKKKKQRLEAESSEGVLTAASTVTVTEDGNTSSINTSLINLSSERRFRIIPKEYLIMNNDFLNKWVITDEPFDTGMTTAALLVATKDKPTYIRNGFNNANASVTGRFTHHDFCMPNYKDDSVYSTDEASVMLIPLATALDLAHPHQWFDSPVTSTNSSGNGQQQQQLSLDLVIEGSESSGCSVSAMPATTGSFNAAILSAKWHQGSAIAAILRSVITSRINPTHLPSSSPVVSNDAKIQAMATWALAEMYLRLAETFAARVSKENLHNVQFTDTNPQLVRLALLNCNLLLGSGTDPVTNIWFLSDARARPNGLKTITVADWSIIARTLAVWPMTKWPVKGARRMVRWYIVSTLNRIYVEPLAKLVCSSNRQLKQNRRVSIRDTMHAKVAIKEVDGSMKIQNKAIENTGDAVNTTSVLADVTTADDKLNRLENQLKVLSVIKNPTKAQKKEMRRLRYHLKKNATLPSTSSASIVVENSSGHINSVANVNDLFGGNSDGDNDEERVENVNVDKAVESRKDKLFISFKLRMLVGDILLKNNDSSKLSADSTHVADININNADDGGMIRQKLIAQLRAILKSTASYREGRCKAKRLDRLLRLGDVQTALLIDAEWRRRGLWEGNTIDFWKSRIETFISTSLSLDSTSVGNDMNVETTTATSTNVQSSPSIRGWDLQILFQTSVARSDQIGICNLANRFTTVINSDESVVATSDDNPLKQKPKPQTTATVQLKTINDDFNQTLEHISTLLSYGEGLTRGSRGQRIMENLKKEWAARDEERRKSIHRRGYYKRSHSSLSSSSSSANVSSSTAAQKSLSEIYRTHLRECFVFVGVDDSSSIARVVQLLLENIQSDGRLRETLVVNALQKLDN